MTMQMELRVRCNVLANVCFQLWTWLLVEIGIWWTDRSWRQHNCPPREDAATTAPVPSAAQA